jgi:hypothetical protein
VYKVGTKKSWATEEIRVIKKKPMVPQKQKQKKKMKPDTLHWDIRKDALRASQELTRPQPSQPQGYTSMNSFERLSLGNRWMLGYSTCTGLPRKVLPNIQPPWPSEAAISMAQRGLAIAQPDGKS